MTIEERLDAIEAKIMSLEADQHPKPTGKTQQRNDDRLDALEKAVEELKK